MEPRQVSQCRMHPRSRLGIARPPHLEPVQPTGQQAFVGPRIQGVGEYCEWYIAWPRACSAAAVDDFRDYFPENFRQRVILGVYGLGAYFKYRVLEPQSGVLPKPCIPAEGHVLVEY